MDAKASVLPTTPQRPTRLYFKTLKRNRNRIRLVSSTCDLEIRRPAANKVLKWQYSFIRWHRTSFILNNECNSQWYVIKLVESSVDVGRWKTRCAMMWNTSGNLGGYTGGCMHLFLLFVQRRGRPNINLTGVLPMQTSRTHSQYTARSAMGCIAHSRHHDPSQRSTHCLPPFQGRPSNWSTWWTRVFLGRPRTHVMILKGEMLWAFQFQPNYLSPRTLFQAWPFKLALILIVPYTKYH